MKEFLKSANIWRSYERKISLVFFDAQCTFCASTKDMFHIGRLWAYTTKDWGPNAKNEKGKLSIYIGSYIAHAWISQFYLQITPCLPFLRKCSPDGVTPDWGSEHQIAAYYSFIDPKGTTGWVGLVGWHIADGLQTYLVTRQLQLQRTTGKVPRPETDVPPLCHATNLHSSPTTLTTAYQYYRENLTVKQQKSKMNQT